MVGDEEPVELMDEIDEEWWCVDDDDSMSTSMGVSISGYKSNAG